MSICLLAAGKTAVFAATAFTLSWTHSVQKTEWQEDWRVTPDHLLEITAARIKGSGAGMEPPEGAVLRDGWWVYVPTIKPLPKLTLASSGATDSGWQICFGTACVQAGATPGAPVELEACKADGI